MKFYYCPLWLFVTSFFACLLLIPILSLGQSLTAGGVVGTVTDPSGAAVPNANVGPIACSSSNVFNNYVATPACMTTSQFYLGHDPGRHGGRSATSVETRSTARIISIPISP
jgi:hypothetical protein